MGNMRQPPQKMYSDFPDSPVPVSDGTFGWGGLCEERKQSGYDSGMGLIFRVAAMISPIPTRVQASSRSGDSEPAKDLTPQSGSGDSQPSKVSTTVSVTKANTKDAAPSGDAADSQS